MNRAISAPRTLKSSIGPAVGVGAVGAVLLFVTLGLWAYLTWIDSAVTATGQAIARGKPQMVQSLDGGVVEEIRVANGDQVRAGDLVARLDPTLLRVTLDIARTRLGEALARQARLAAEAEGQSEVAFLYPDLPFPRPETALAEAGQQRIFFARAALSQGRRDQLVERQSQFAHQIDGVSAGILSKEEQLAYIQKELDTTRTLQSQGLVRESQLLQIQRTAAEMEGALAEARAEQARLRNALQDAQIELEQSEREFREQVVTDLRTTLTEIEELTLQIVTLSRQLERVDLRAPMTGVVHEMTVATRGGVVAPGGTLMQIIPLEGGVEFELMLDPRDIDQVHPGQQAQVVFTAFDQRATPRLGGKILRISPAAVSDPTSGRSFYRLALAIDPGEREKLPDQAIMPGMPVEAFIETGEHRVMDYLLQPLTNQIMRAFRES